MLERAVFATGWWGKVPLPPRFRWETIPWDRWARALEPRRGGSVLLLGGEALVRVSPGAFRRRLHAPYALAIAVPEGGGRAETGPWSGIEGLEVAAPAELEAALDRACAIPPRVAIPLERWLRVVGDPSTEFREIARLVGGLPSAKPKDWRHVTGLDPHALNDLCREATGRTSSKVCREFCRAYRVVESARGIPRTHVALSLGYAGPRSLRRADR